MIGATPVLAHALGSSWLCKTARTSGQDTFAEPEIRSIRGARLSTLLLSALKQFCTAQPRRAEAWSDVEQPAAFVPGDGDPSASGSLNSDARRIASAKTNLPRCCGSFVGSAWPFEHRQSMT